MGPTLVGDHPCAGVEVSKAVGKRLTIEGSKAAISLEEGVGSSPAAGPLFTEVISNGPTMLTLSFREEDLELGEDFFI